MYVSHMYDAFINTIKVPAGHAWGFALVKYVFSRVFSLLAKERLEPISKALTEEAHSY